MSLSREGRQILLLVWAIFSLIAIILGIVGAASTPAPPPDTRSTIKDPRALLAAPMGLFIGLQQGFMYTSYVKVISTFLFFRVPYFQNKKTEPL